MFFIRWNFLWLCFFGEILALIVQAILISNYGYRLLGVQNSFEKLRWTFKVFHAAIITFVICFTFGYFSVSLSEFATFLKGLFSLMGPKEKIDDLVEEINSGGNKVPLQCTVKYVVDNKEYIFLTKIFYEEWATKKDQFGIL